MVDLNWDQIKSKPTKDHKVKGEILIGMRDKLATQDADLKDVRSKLSSITSERDATAQKLSDATAKAEKLEHELQGSRSSFEDQASSQASELEAATTRANELDARLKESEAKVSALESSLQGATSRADQGEGKASELAIRVAELEAQVTELESKVTSAEDDLAKVLVERDSLKASLQGYIDASTPEIEPEAPVMVKESINVRACMTCKQYVMLREDYKHQRAAEIFDMYHRGHMISTLDLDEVKDKKYLTKTDEFLKKADGAEAVTDQE